MKKKDLREILAFETNVYRDYSYQTFYRKLMGFLKHEYVYQTMRWQKTARITDYYKHKIDHSYNPLYWFLYIVYIRKRNILAEKIGVEIATMNIGKGLLIYHSQGTVINGKAIIGENCRLHGNICIGNGGENDKKAPVIGNNVTIGAGAKIIGGVTIADDIKIAAGSVVVHSFTEKGITIAGIPAKKVK